MTQSTLQSRQSERGFTLVELAIVMIIIGLLIGGILKGQELINNARVSSTVAQIKAVESGISAFRDKYAGLPGDLVGANIRVPGCTAAGPLCFTAAAGGVLGDGQIAGAGGAFDPGLAGVGTTEAGIAFVHMAAAGMVGGVQPGATAFGAAVTNPTTPLGGAWAIGTSTGAAATGMQVIGGLAAGVYVASSPAVAVAIPATDVQIMTPAAAANIDRKVDDGQPSTGIVRAIGLAAGSATSCTNNATAAAVYNEALSGSLCGVYAKVQ